MLLEVVGHCPQCGANVYRPLCCTPDRPGRLYSCVCEPGPQLVRATRTPLGLTRALLWLPWYGYLQRLLAETRAV